MRFCLWVIDCLDVAALDVFKVALKKAANVTMLTSLPVEDVHVGLCFVRLNNAAHLELKFLLKPAAISLGAFHSAVDRLQPSEERSDQQKLAAVLKKVVERLLTAVDQSGFKQEAIKEIYVVSNTLEYGEAMRKLLNMAEKKDIQMKFFAFTDDCMKVLRPISFSGVIKGVCDQGGDNGKSVDDLHDLFAREVEDMPHVSFKHTIGSAVTVDRMVMGWIGDCIECMAVPLTLCFDKTQPAYRFPCLACNRLLDLGSKVPTTSMNDCHAMPTKQKPCKYMQMTNIDPSRQTKHVSPRQAT